MALDLLVGAGALSPILLWAHYLGILAAVVSPVPCLDPAWVLAVIGIAMLYAMHGFIWNFPERFTALSRSAPFSLLGAHPWKVFAKLEMFGKVWQFGCIALYLGEAGRAAVLTALASTPWFVFVLSALYVAAGQTLNVAMYTSIGDAGVYYGFKLGATVPWCTGFPFNVQLRHPQYVGVVLTFWAMAFVLLTEELGKLGMPQMMMAWAAMYFVMSTMEQVGDNDTKAK